jgi:hypothetical protein
VGLRLDGGLQSTRSALEAAILSAWFEVERGDPRGGRFCLRRQGSQSAGDRQLAPDPSTEHGRGEVLACAYCGRAITTRAARIEVNGLHAHSFANPEGINYRVGCFADAGGLVVVGPRSTYWTWFAGYSWQVELCANCRQQLGWYYRSADGVFHGLILDRLVEVEEGTPH